MNERINLSEQKCINLSERYRIRYSMNDRQVEAAYNRFYAATDLYYADFFEADGKSFEFWDSNENGFYGEQQCESSSLKASKCSKIDDSPRQAPGSHYHKDQNHGKAKRGEKV